jgi:hypothetical protein
MLNNEDLINNLIPNAELSRVILQSDRNDKLLTNIQFVLRETYTNDNVSSWLEDAQILKYLKIFVIESADKRLTNDLNRYFSNLENRITIQNGDAVSLIRSLPFVSQKRNKIKIKTIDLNSLINNGQNTNNITELVKKGLAEKTDNSDGSTTYDIFIDTNFTAVPGEEQILREDAEHLSYIFATTYNLRELFGDLIDTNEPIFGTGNIGKFVTETIIDNSEVNNTKAQDFREVKKSISSLDIQLEELGQSLTEFEPVQIEQNLIDANDNSCISELYGSINNDRDASISFAIDFRKMFIKNSVYGNVLSKTKNSISNSFIDRMYKAAVIDSIVLKAKRIDIDDALSNIKQNEIVVKEIQSSNLASIEKPLIFKNLTALQSEQIRFFSISDNRKLAGTYQYSVEISYRDSVKELLDGIITQLKTEKLKFEEYYKASTMPGVFNVVTGRFRSRNIAAISLVDSLRDFRMQYEGLRDIRTSARAYLETLTSLYSASREKIELLFEQWLRPQLTTPELINSVVRLYDALIEQLTKNISSTPFINNSLNEKGEGSQTIEKVQSTSKTVVIKKVFNNTITLDKDYLYEYLDSSRSDTTNNRTAFSFEAIKTDLLFKKIQATSNLSAGRNSADLNASVFKDLQNMFYDLSSLYIQRQIDVQPSTSARQSGQTSYFATPQGFINQITRQDPADIMQDTDKQVLNNTLLTLLGPTVRLSPQNLELIIDTSNNENLLDRIQPNVATTAVPNGSDRYITNLFKDTEINSRLINSFPNQIKSLIKLKIESPDTLIDDAKIRFKYEMLKQIKVLNGFAYDNINKTFSLQQPIWEVLDGIELLLQPTNTNKRFFCSIKDYENSDIKYSFNKALREKCSNEHFFINAAAINNRGAILDSATDISAVSFERRCEKELADFFSGQTQPDVAFDIDGRRANPADSYAITKYTYLSPHGVYFDTQFVRFQ